MKINRNNTALHFLEDGNRLNFGIVKKNDWHQVQTDALRHRAMEHFKNNKAAYLSTVQYLSDPFLNAYEQAKDRIQFDLRTEDIRQAGTIVVKGDSGKGRNTIFYNVQVFLEKKASGEEVMHFKGHMLCFSNGLQGTNLPVLTMAYITKGNGEGMDYVGDGRMSQPGMTAFDLWFEIVQIIKFMKYCDLETKVVKGQRKAEHAGHKYVNEGQIPVEIVDSTWFTTIIRSEGFGVKGHFRLQPCGPGLTNRKLIYIMPFEKQGYTRKAKILINNERQEADSIPGASGE